MNFIKEVSKNIIGILLCTLIIFMVGVIDFIGLCLQPFGKREKFEDWVDKWLVKLFPKP